MADAGALAGRLGYVDGAGGPMAVAPRLGPGDYRALDAFLGACGGRWDRRAGGHLFGEGRDPREAVEEGLRLGYQHEANPHGFFPTPAALASELARATPDDMLAFGLAERPGARAVMLEPSAGRGAMVVALRGVLPADRLDVIAFEVDARHHGHLRRLGVEPRPGSFLDAAPEPVADVALMNPPFRVPGMRAGWVAHVLRARRWLKPDGTLGAVLPARRTLAGADSAPAAEVGLEAVLNADGGWAPAPDGSFARPEDGAPATGTATRLAWIHGPEDGDGERRRGRCEHGTMLIVGNNDHRMLEEALRGLPERRGAAGAELVRRLDGQRARWIWHGAPWIEGVVRTGAIADGLLDRDREWPREEDAGEAPAGGRPPAAGRAQGSLAL